MSREARYPNTIYLHRHGSSWVAYQHSALLLRQYFNPVKVRTFRIGRERFLQSVWKDTVSLCNNASGTLMLRFDQPSPDKMMIHCPSSIGDSELSEALRCRFHPQNILWRIEAYFMRVDPEYAQYRSPRICKIKQKI